MKKYSVKEILLTLQGEGFNTGKTAIFCRFTGCNLWNGKSKGKEKAICNFCDTDFIGTNGINGGKYLLNELVNKVEALWPTKKDKKFIVFTGGEPLLQLDSALVNILKKNNFFVAIETNGTICPPDNIDWICVSPKVKSKLKVKNGNEIKIVYPQENIKIKEYEKLNFKHYYIQPLDNKNYLVNKTKAIDFVIKNPNWKLSLQTHKYIGIK